MEELHCEVAVIGAGTAGMGAYRAARQHGDKVLLIEGAHYGTTCARVGCMPSKLLIAAADAAHGIREARRFGVIAAAPRIDGPAVMARVRSERDRFVGFVTEAVDGWPAADKLWGMARFLGEGLLQVGEHSRVRAERIVIATGSHPVVPSGWREALGERLIVNDELFDWQDLPGSVAVVGTGVIGLELAQALHRLGVRVRLLGRSRKVGPLSDPALQALTAELMAAELPLSLEARELQLSREG
ncbi:MAG: FAD-dependent oxidoreductase, partial [Burkholderiaceae bacterium]